MDTVTLAQFHALLDEVFDSALEAFEDLGQHRSLRPAGATCPTCGTYGPIVITPDTLHCRACGHTLLWPETCRETRRRR